MTYSSYGWGYCEVPPTKMYAKLKDSGWHECILLGIFSTPGVMLSARILLKNGGMISKFPINNLSLKPHTANTNFYNLYQKWDCLSYGVSCTKISYLEGKNLHILGHKTWGDYLFTLIPWAGDYTDNDYPLGYKDFHILSTSYGLVAMPNTKLHLPNDGFVEDDFNSLKKIPPMDKIPSCER